MPADRLRITCANTLRPAFVVVQWQCLPCAFERHVIDRRSKDLALPDALAAPVARRALGVPPSRADLTRYFMCTIPFISPTLSFARSVSAAMASICAFCTISDKTFMSASLLCHAF